MSPKKKASSKKRAATKSPSPSPKRSGKKAVRRSKRANTKEGESSKKKDNKDSETSTKLAPDKEVEEKSQQKKPATVKARRKSSTKNKSPPVKARKTAAKSKQLESKKDEKDQESKKAKSKKKKKKWKRTTPLKAASKKADEGTATSSSNDGSTSAKEDAGKEESTSSSLITRVSAFLTPMKRSFRPWDESDDDDSSSRKKQKQRAGQEDTLDNPAEEQHSADDGSNSNEPKTAEQQRPPPESPLNLTNYRSPAALLRSSKKNHPSTEDTRDTIQSPPQATLTATVGAVGKLITPRINEQVEVANVDQSNEEEESAENAGPKESSNAASKATSILKRFTTSSKRSTPSEETPIESENVEISAKPVSTRNTTKKSKSPKASRSAASQTETQKSETAPNGSGVVTPAPTRTRSQRLASRKVTTSPIIPKTKIRGEQASQSKKSRTHKSQDVESMIVEEEPTDRQSRSLLLLFVTVLSLSFFFFILENTSTGIQQRDANWLNIGKSSTDSIEKGTPSPYALTDLFSSTSIKSAKTPKKEPKIPTSTPVEGSDDKIGESAFGWFSGDSSGVTRDSKASPTFSPVIDSLKGMFRDESPTPDDGDANSPVLTAAWKLLPTPSDETEVQSKSFLTTVLTSIHGEKHTENPPEPSVLMAAWNAMSSSTEEDQTGKPKTNHVLSAVKEEPKAEYSLETEKQDSEPRKAPLVTVSISKSTVSRHPKAQVEPADTSSVKPRSGSRMPGREIRQSLRRKMVKERKVSRDARLSLHPSTIKTSIGKTLMRISPATVTQGSEAEASEFAFAPKRKRQPTRSTVQPKVATQQPFEATRVKTSLASKTRNLVKRYTSFSSMKSSSDTPETSSRKRFLFKPRNNAMKKPEASKSNSVFDKSKVKEFKSSRPIKVPSKQEVTTDKPSVWQETISGFDLFRSILGRDKIKAEMEAREKLFEKIVSQFSSATPLSRASNSVPLIRNKATSQPTGGSQDNTTSGSSTSVTEDDRSTTLKRTQRVLNFIIQENPLYNQFHAK